MTRKKEVSTQQRSNILLIAVHAPYNRTKNIDSYFEEFENLVKSNNIPYEHILRVKLREIDSSTFITRGKLDEIKAYCDEHKIEEVILSESINAKQERNLQDHLDCTIFDRTHLILEIFEKAAHSAEGKLQVQIALLKHKKTRLAGKGILMSQQGGGIGQRGGYGETAKEKETRVLDNYLLKIKRELKQLQSHRDTQRKRRLISGLPLICLIGYTNVGKSTILNMITKSNVLAEDKLFATLDTTTRELYINSKKIGLLSDTVGFIQQLPHNLIEAFKSTLSELKYADLLLHVVDSADPNWQEHIEVVHSILKQLSIDSPMLYVFNKIDKLAEAELVDLDFLASKYRPHVAISTLTKEGTQPLLDYIEQFNSYKAE